MLIRHHCTYPRFDRRPAPSNAACPYTSTLPLHTRHLPTVRKQASFSAPELEQRGGVPLRAAADSRDGGSCSGSAGSAITCCALSDVATQALGCATSGRGMGTGAGEEGRQLEPAAVAWSTAFGCKTIYHVASQCEPNAASPPGLQPTQEQEQQPGGCRRGAHQLRKEQSLPGAPAEPQLPFSAIITRPALNGPLRVEGFDQRSGSAVSSTGSCSGGAAGATGAGTAARGSAEQERRRVPAVEAGRLSCKLSEGSVGTTTGASAAAYQAAASPEQRRATPDGGCIDSSLCATALQLRAAATAAPPAGAARTSQRHAVVAAAAPGADGYCNTMDVGAAPLNASARGPSQSEAWADMLAWRYRFTHKWRRARQVTPADALDDSPDPLAFLSAHGAATAATLAAGAGSGALAAPPRRSRLRRRPSGTRLSSTGGGGPLAAACGAGGGSGSGASSLAGTSPAYGMALPRVFSGGEMHKQLVAEAQRAHEALEQLSAVQDRCAAAAAAANLAPTDAPGPQMTNGGISRASPGAEDDVADSAGERPWVGPLLPVVTLDYPSVSQDPFILVRVVEGPPAPGSSAANADPCCSGQSRSKLLLRAAAAHGFGCGTTAACEQLLVEVEAEMVVGAAAWKLPLGAEVHLLGLGTLLKAGTNRIKVVPCTDASAHYWLSTCAGGFGKGEGMAPGAVVSLAAALLRQSAPAEWVILN